MLKYHRLMMEFHISREARDYYQFDQSLFSSSGNVIFANFHAARVFAQKMNQKRDLVNFPEQSVKSGQINALGLIDEILHLVIAQYRLERNPYIIEQAYEWLCDNVGQNKVDATLHKFTEQYPPVTVYQNEISLDDYINQSTNGVPHHLIALEEMILLWVTNVNPACSTYLELFDDSLLEKETAYLDISTSLHKFFDTQPSFGPENQNLLDMLRSPAIAVPHSLPGQLEYIRTKWGYILGSYLYRLLSSLDLIKEEEKAIFFGPGQAVIYDFFGLEVEPERFSPDKDWMPSLVLIAKNAHVWLDQLSKKYERQISRLDEIPDEELDTLANSGFTGLWLIGLWERSPASKKIKQLRGNPDAVASAYSLFSYDIASELGGEEAYQSLRDRAWHKGIRLASDMVPNHMGIDSRWVVEHPDWFISLEHSPFPSYTFSGPNLSWDSRVGIYLEDHYFDNSDAAVAFKRVDFWTGQEKYIYHGNDGTSMPWNDTAQLDFLKSEVREAVMQTILHVARKFPIIRFDAAMTLAKKHFQRLWFPVPGSGGDIPSRAEYGLTKEQFDEIMPVEFWREVVDRVAQEVPDTLLLAEAFWLMEGYFVRTLGMHRVYNSAFMNMLRDEKNQDYRSVIKNTLEFDTEILKRYVNFMNNPDERTTVDQFGKGDKYFGICTLMATLPGLPMFGHGQIEGFTEKYGMEYQRAYWDEIPDRDLIERHEREIFPLLRRRYLFAEAHNFLLYDFYSPDNHVNEDVFAYSNRAGDERALVVYHNKYSSTQGWIRNSAAFLEKSASGDERTLRQKSLGEGLNLLNDDRFYTIFRDHVSGLEYIRNNKELHDQGLFVALDAYKYSVFLDFREVQDDNWRQYNQLTEYLNGRGVPSIDEALQEIFLQPIHTPFNELVNPGQLQWLIDNRALKDNVQAKVNESVFNEVEDKAIKLLNGIKEHSSGTGDSLTIGRKIREEVFALLQIPVLQERFPKPRSRKYKAALKYIDSGLSNQPDFHQGASLAWGTLLSWIFTHSLGEMVSNKDYAGISRTWIGEWLLGKIIANTLINMGLSEHVSWRSLGIIKLLNSHQDWYDGQIPKKQRAYHALQSWLRDNELQQFLGVNRYQDVLWFNSESFQELLWWMFLISLVKTSPKMGQSDLGAQEIITQYEVITELLKAAEESGYQVEGLLEAVKN